MKLDEKPIRKKREVLFTSLVREVQIKSDVLGSI